jgi:NADPH:quinone reductase-like Zn-dependent oxidoreductase
MANMNRVLFQDEVGVPGVIRERALPTSDELGDRKVLIKVHAWAMNPCDSILQMRTLPFVKYPVVLGQDVAGTVEAVAPGSTAASKFSVGDRVFGFTANNGFQEYVPLDHTLMAKIPGDMPYRDVVVFGLCITTSTFSLFGKDYLHLDYPKLGTPKKGKSVFIWGGSSAVGSNAIQMAMGAGYDVITTCSPRNFDYVKGLGAVKAFDYNSATVIEDVAAELDKGECVGIYMASGSTSQACKVSAASKQNVSRVPSLWWHEKLTRLRSLSPRRTLSRPTISPRVWKPSSHSAPASSPMSLAKVFLPHLVDTSSRHWRRGYTRSHLCHRW